MITLQLDNKEESTSIDPVEFYNLKLQDMERKLNYNMMLKEKLITPKKISENLLIRNFDYCSCKSEFNFRTKILFF